ncbi:SIR2 family protein [Methylovulum psychrotolerans]|uniref:SIR2 family NAD-dependent protein deacylase n=1 Tax=Methylovulum psychrotolerans TaxID=1704499 RepID=UPI001BFF45B0|nr:SIR2 family protein [Methylovulum psychrotolerans]MBT9097126.1 SIR2 family protein [Methylovulum psychrotolerans]
METQDLYYAVIAYAAASNNLCLFTGAGFSKAITDNNALSWEDLLKKVCDNSELLAIKDALFSSEKAKPDLEIAAHIINIELNQHKKDIYSEIASIINDINLSSHFEEENNAIHNFLKKIEKLKVITTNYDMLFEKLATAAKESYVSIAEGQPIFGDSANIEVYHIHGHIDWPQYMIVTVDDYFKFMSKESYFSRKLSTLLYESTVVFLGYSLEDHNLKRIINDYKISSQTDNVQSNLFFVSRYPIDQHIKAYYENSYGIQVIDNTETENFFKKTNEHLKDTSEAVKHLGEIVKSYLDDGKNCPNEYLQYDNLSFINIINAFTLQRKSIKNEDVINLIKDIVSKKIDLAKNAEASQKQGQYETLASWLIYLSRSFDIEKTELKDTFLKVAYDSLSNPFAYNRWKNEFPTIKPSNREIIVNYINGQLEEKSKENTNFSEQHVYFASNLKENFFP